MIIKEPLFWLAFWLSMPWVGCVLIFLSKPNRLYSRRVLMWSVGCFVALSLTLLFMHGALPTAWTSIVTRQHGVLGMALALGLALAAWPTGQSAIALGSLGCFLMAMVGFSEKIWPSFVIAMALMIWICRPLFLMTDQNGKKRLVKTLYQTTFLGQFLAAVLCLFSIYFFGYTQPIVHNLMKKTELNPVVSDILWISGIDDLFHFFKLIIYMVLIKKIYQAFKTFNYGHGKLPLAADKKTLHAEASPEWMAFWNPWQRLNMGLYEMFMWFMIGNVAIIWRTIVKESSFSLNAELIASSPHCIAFPITAILTILHVYALFQPRFVPYRWLLLCSMGYCMFALFRMVWFILPPGSQSNIGLITTSIVVYGVILWRILRPLILARRYAALLNPHHAQKPTGLALSRGWVVALLSSSVMWGIWVYYVADFQMLRLLL